MVVIMKEGRSNGMGNSNPPESFYDEEDGRGRINNRVGSNNSDDGDDQADYCDVNLEDGDDCDPVPPAPALGYAASVLLESGQRLKKVDPAITTKKSSTVRGGKNNQPQSPSCVSYGDDNAKRAAQKNQPNPSYISYVDDNAKKRASKGKSSASNGLGVGSHAVSGNSQSSLPQKTGRNSDNPPSYISYLEDDQDEISGPMAMPDGSGNSGAVRRRQQEQRPGAYASGANGERPERAPTLRFSLVGLQDSDDDNGDDFFTDEEGQQQQQQLESNVTTEYDIVGGGDQSGTSDQGPGGGGLVVATAIKHSHQRASMLPAAQGIDVEAMQRKKDEDDKKRLMFKVGAGLLLLVAVVTIVVLAVTMTNRTTSSSNDDPSYTTITTDSPSMHPTTSPTRPLPPMENLDILYDNLQEKTKESLYYKDSVQYMAWEWLLNHPNITTFEEWRKKQIFAMATFFYSFQGHHWEESTSGSGRWMNYTLDECSWVFNDVELGFMVQQSSYVLGPGVYTYEDFKPCNQKGELQTIVLNQLFLPTNLKVSIPPEIEFLTSLKIMGVSFSRINSQLSDFFGVPEFTSLPNLRALSIIDSGLTGTIPKEVFLMTDLRHILIGGNQLTGTIPPEIAWMNSTLEYFNVHGTKTLSGKIPSEIGLMTTLTSLDLGWSSFTGTIPTELASMSNNMRKLTLDGNQLSGAIPSELGLLTGNTWLALYDNRLTGSIPTELGLMTNTAWLRIWNNALTGSIPSELGLMTNLVHFRLGNDLELEDPRNDFSGSLPQELWEFSNMEELFLPNLPNLRGSIPSEVMMPNLALLSLSGSPHISGTIPDQVCIFVEELDFDCSDLLCGCDCKCGTTGLVNNSDTGEDSPISIHDDQAWPGLFPTPVNRSNAIAINIRTDRHPEETKYVWSLRNPSGLWSILDSEEPLEQEQVHTYTKEVESNSVYRLELFDSQGDGTCCANGFGWITITDSIPSPDHAEGTVIWEAAGSLLGGSFHVYIRVDQEGRAKVLEHLTGPRDNS